MKYQPFSNKLYDKVNEILEEHDQHNDHRTHTTAKIIDAIYDELDNGGWSRFYKTTENGGFNSYSLWELRILSEAEQKAIGEIEQIKANGSVQKDDLTEIFEPTS